jgi:hypothetical protein
VPSLLTRLRNAGAALLGRQERLNGSEYYYLFYSFGLPAGFRPMELFTAFGDNPWLYAHIGIDDRAKAIKKLPDWQRFRRRERAFVVAGWREHRGRGGHQ